MLTELVTQFTLRPIVINYGNPIPRLATAYTSDTPEKTVTGQLRAVAATAESIIDGKRCTRPGRIPGCGRAAIAGISPVWRNARPSAAGNHARPARDRRGRCPPGELGV